MRVTAEISHIPCLSLLARPPLDMPGLLLYFVAIVARQYPEATSIMILWRGYPIAGRVRP